MFAELTYEVHADAGRVRPARPGESTTKSGRAAATCSTVTSSLRLITHSWPSRPKYCAGLYTNES